MTYAIDDDPMTPCEHESEVKHQIEQVRTDVNNISPLTETRPKIVDVFLRLGSLTQMATKLSLERNIILRCVKRRTLKKNVASVTFYIALAEKSRLV